MMRVFWWSDPMSPTRMLRTALLEGGLHAQIDSLPMFDVQVAHLLAEGAQEISWKTAQLLGWPT